VLAAVATSAALMAAGARAAAMGDSASKMAAVRVKDFMIMETCLGVLLVVSTALSSLLLRPPCGVIPQSPPDQCLTGVIQSAFRHAAIGHLHRLALFGAIYKGRAGVLDEGT
jgi:hypothetical protein